MYAGLLTRNYPNRASTYPPQAGPFAARISIGRLSSIALPLLSGTPRHIEIYVGVLVVCKLLAGSVEHERQIDCFDILVRLMVEVIQRCAHATQRGWTPLTLSSQIRGYILLVAENVLNADGHS